MVKCQLSCKISSKKSGIGIDEFVALLVAVLVFAIAIIFVRISDNVSDRELKSEILKEKMFSDASFNLMSFLRQQNEQGTVSDLILSYYYLNDLDKIAPLIREFFDAKYSSEWFLIVEDHNDNLIFSIDSDEFYLDRIVATDTTVRTISEAAHAYLPLMPQSNNFLKIRLMLRLPKEGVIVK